MMRTLFVLALALSTASCGDLLTGIGGSVQGTYTLRSIDGERLPATIVYVSPSNYVEMLEGSLRLGNDGSFIDHSTTRDVRNGQGRVESTTSSGRWSQSGDEILLTDPDDPRYAARGYLAGATLTFDRFGGVNARAVYSR